MLLSLGVPKFTQGTYHPVATNNSCELQAVIDGLFCCYEQGLSNDDLIEVYSDSTYVINALTKGWIENWIEKDFYYKGGILRPNTDLWKELVEVINLIKCDIDFNWVRGHDGNKWNEYVDDICTKVLELEEDVFVEINNEPLKGDD